MKKFSCVFCVKICRKTTCVTPAVVIKRNTCHSSHCELCHVLNPCVKSATKNTTKSVRKKRRSRNPRLCLEFLPRITQHIFQTKKCHVTTTFFFFFFQQSFRSCSKILLSMHTINQETIELLVIHFFRNNTSFLNISLHYKKTWAIKLFFTHKISTM